MTETSGSTDNSRRTLGTFSGVFTPSILTILGIILFLRHGYVVGSAGLPLALLIIVAANLISVLTTISLAAVATNMKVKGGGVYYLISRTLGVEFGGAIGLLLFVAQSVSITFYCIGFGEAVSAFFPESGMVSPQVIAFIAVSFLLFLAWLGADWATRFQYGVMALLAAALVSFYAGALFRWDTALFSASLRMPAGVNDFWIIFAIFFPAVTGFTQGVSMSGDLKEPGRSMTRGTFMAVGLSVIVYLSAAILFAGTLPLEVLADDYGAMKRVSAMGFLVDAGVIAATLSSAMASFLGAPRILQSLAGDRVFPLLSPFAKGAGPAENPRRAVLLSGVIAYLTIALGKLNLIAPVVSMFFLISYGLLNYATYFEARSFSPSFRPRFRFFHYRLSLLGALACLGAMLAVDTGTALVAVAILFGVYQYVKRTAGPSRWADSQRSYYLQRIREYLLAVSEEPEHPRDWRPHILAFSDDIERRGRLLTFATWIESRSGLTTVVQIIEGSGAGVGRIQKEAEEKLEADIRSREMKIFSRALVTPDPETGIQVLAQAYGVGPLRANTILLNWLSPVAKNGRGFRELMLGMYLRAAFRLGCNIMLLNATEEKWERLSGCSASGCRIDVWWFDDRTSRVMLLSAYLMTRSRAWDGALIRVLAGTQGGTAEARHQEIEKMLTDVRIEAAIKIVDQMDAESLISHSGDASVMFIPFRFKANHMTTPFKEGSLDEMLADLPTCVLVAAAEDIDLEAEPDEGKAGEIAEAQDRVISLEKQLDDTEKQARKAAGEAEKQEEAIESARSSMDAGADPDALEKLRNRAQQAKNEADEMKRKAAKLKAKKLEAEKALSDLGVPVETETKDEDPQAEPEK